MKTWSHDRRGVFLRKSACNNQIYHSYCKIAGMPTYCHFKFINEGCINNKSLCNCRSWKRHYSSIKDLDDRRKVHNILLSLMEEVDETKFQESLAGFIQVWQARCPLFIKYFQSNYASNERTRESIDPRIRLLSRYGSLIPHQNWNPQILPGFRVE